jgi:hypothetical protein
MNAAAVVDFEAPFDLEKAVRAIAENLHDLRREVAEVHDKVRKIDAGQTIIVRCCRHCQSAEAESMLARIAAQEAGKLPTES